MTDNIIKLVRADQAPNDVIDTLKHMLERADQGEISSVAIAFVSKDGGVGGVAAAMPSIAAQFGSLNLLQSRLIGVACSGD
jgi:hypothetical protein